MTATPFPDTASRGLRRAFDALGEPAFRWWFFSQILSGSGSMTQAIAMSWVVLKLTRNGVALGAVTACTFGPLLAFGAFGGSFVDRHDRRRVLIGTQLALSAIAGALGALSISGSMKLWMLYLAALGSGLVMAIDQPARQVFVVELVGDERTANAVSLNEVVINASRILGPAAGGALLATAGAGGCFLLNAGSYLPTLIVLALPLTAHTVASRRVEPTAHGHGSGALVGLRYVWRRPAIRAVVVMAAVSGMLFNLGVALPLLATRVFHQGGGGYGVMMGAFGVGAIGGAVIAASGHSWASGREVRVLALLTGAAVLATAAAPDLGLELAGLAGCGVVSIWFIARANALAQLRAEGPVRGRVMAVWTMALPGMNPVFALLVGAVAQGLGARQGFALAGVGLAACAVLFWQALADAPRAQMAGAK
ncbi:MAG: MFS transporter [Actinomycetota bacterium]|nr:MFS transporter [Actinomycetota bacterium]